MENPLSIVKFDREGRLILEMTPAMRDLLRDALEVAVEVDGVLKVDLTQVTSAPERFARIDDPPCMIFAFARIDDPPCHPEIKALPGIPRAGMEED